MRQANSTIKGYLYQFNKSIMEILCASDEDNITLEGAIEDIDIIGTDCNNTIQCKYHEHGKYSISDVAIPILEMLCNYIENATFGKKTKYILYAYYSQNVEVIDKEDFVRYIFSTNSQDVQISYFHRIFKIDDDNILSIANKSKKKAEEKSKLIAYYKDKRKTLNLCVDLNSFWDNFIYIKAEQYDKLKENIIKKLAELSDNETALHLYYPNAISLVAYKSTNQSINDRTISRTEFINSLKEQKSSLLNKWMLLATDRNKMLKLKKNHLKDLFALNSEIRAFLFSENFINDNSEDLLVFIQDYISKYYKKKTLQKPPLFIFSNSSNVMQNIILGLRKYQRTVNCGLVGNAFIVDSFINNTDCSPDFVCKITEVKNIDAFVLEKCLVNQLFIIGCINYDLKSDSYQTEKLEIQTVNELKYLVNINKYLEE